MKKYPNNHKCCSRCGIDFRPYIDDSNVGEPCLMYQESDGGILQAYFNVGYDETKPTYYFHWQCKP